jgi:hypothetical protein
VTAQAAAEAEEEAELKRREYEEWLRSQEKEQQE